MEIYVVHYYEMGEGFDEPTQSSIYFETIEDTRDEMEDIYQEAVDDLRKNWYDEMEDAEFDDLIKKLSDKYENNWTINDEDNGYHIISVNITRERVHPATRKPTTNQTVFWPGDDPKETLWPGDSPEEEST